MLRRIYNSRWCKWTRRLLTLLIVLLAGTIAVMSVASVETADTRKSSTHQTIVEADDWPARELPEVLEITRSGLLPIDLGNFKLCRVLSLGKDNKDQGIENFLVAATAASGANAPLKASLRSTGPAGGVETSYQLSLNNQNVVYAQIMPATRQAIGTLLYLGSIAGYSARERKMLNIARDRGWNVLTCSIGIDFIASQIVRIDERGSTRLAHRIDNHLADRAYAMEAMIAYLEAQHPEMLVGPRVIVGMSAGAIALPTVVARIGHVDAAVLIGGGENVAEIIASSPLFSQHIKLVERQFESDEKQKGKLKSRIVPITNPERRNEFTDAVLRKSKLDPHYTAAALKGMPLLMLQAKHDHIVPAVTGQALYESLDRPDRWHYRTGHIGLTLLVPWKIGYVLDWIEEHTPE